MRSLLNRVEDGASNPLHSEDPWRFLSIKLLAEVEVKASIEYTEYSLRGSQQIMLVCCVTN